MLNLKLLLLEDEPTGAKLIEIGNRIVKGFIIPRSRVEKIITRDDINQSGLYFLLGSSEEGKDTVYIGIATNLARRITQHKNDERKAFWKTAILFTTKDNSLSASANNYLEQSCVRFAREADRYEVHNVLSPVISPLSEVEKAEIDDYLSNVRAILSVFGYTFLEKPSATAPQEKKIYRCKGPNANATGKLTDEGFLVFSNSIVRIIQTQSSSLYLKNKLRDLLEKEIIRKVTVEEGIFTKDFIFDSPSAASSIILGRSSNGWTQWKDKSGKTLSENERLK